MTKTASKYRAATVRERTNSIVLKGTFRHSKHAARCRPAFTFVELILAVALTGVLMGGLASAMVLASRAIPDASSPRRITLDNSYAAEHLAAELFTARSVSERTTTAITFTVADRDNDAVAETIRYAWSGTPGDTLTRSYNGGIAQTLADDVREFSLQYSTRVEATTQTETVPGQSPEFLLASFDGWAGVGYTSYFLGPSNWMAEYFEIVFPAGVTTLNITRVVVDLSTGTTDPSAYITAAIHPAIAGNVEPDSTPIGSPATRLASSFSGTIQLEEFLFSDVTITSPAAAGHSLVLKGSVFGAGTGRYQSWRNAPSDIPKLVYTADGGASWEPRANARDQNDMAFSIYATYPTETVQEITIYRYFLKSVRIALLAETDSGTPAATAVSILNEPEVTGP